MEFATPAKIDAEWICFKLSWEEQSLEDGWEKFGFAHRFMSQTKREIAYRTELHQFLLSAGFSHVFLRGGCREQAYTLRIIIADGNFLQIVMIPILEGGSHRVGESFYD